MSSYTIDLPWDKPPLSLNDRMGWQKKMRLVADVRTTTGWAVKAARVPACSRVRIALHYQPAKRRQRDNENLVMTQKPAIDGVVDAGVVRHDSDDLVERYGPVIHPVVPGEPGRLWLVVTDLSDEPREAS